MRCDALNAKWNFWERWADGRWEPETKEVIDEFCHGGTFVDIGAWIGPTALWAAPLSSRVIALEPDPTAFDMLVDNVEDHSNVECHQVAVCGYDGSTTVTTAGDSMSRTGHGGVSVQCRTLRTLFRELDVTGVDLIKIDIEGAERELLATSMDLLREVGAPLVLSTHPWAEWPHDYLSGWDVHKIGDDALWAQL